MSRDPSFHGRISAAESPYQLEITSGAQEWCSRRRTRRFRKRTPRIVPPPRNGAKQREAIGRAKAQALGGLEVCVNNLGVLLSTAGRRENVRDQRSRHVGKINARRPGVTKFAASRWGCGTNCPGSNPMARRGTVEMAGNLKISLVRWESHREKIEKEDNLSRWETFRSGRKSPMGESSGVKVKTSANIFTRSTFMSGGNLQKKSQKKISAGSS